MRIVRVLLIIAAVGIILVPQSALPQTFRSNVTRLDRSDSAGGTRTNDLIWPMYRHDRMHTGYSAGKGHLTSPLFNWSFDDNNSEEAAIGDVDNDGRNEVILATGNTGTYCRRVLCIDGGSGLIKWTFIPDTPTDIYSFYEIAPAIADIDGDGNIEVLVGSNNINGHNEASLFCLTGATGVLKWKFSTTEISYSHFATSPTIADVDDDGVLEVVFESATDFVYCLNANGSQQWVRDLGANGHISWNFVPAVADVDADGHTEVVAVSNYENTLNISLAVLSGNNGNVEWSLEVPPACPVIANVDGDAELEILLSATDSTYCRRGSNGAVQWSFGHGGWSAPAVKDIDADGILEVVFKDFSTDTLYCLKGNNGNIKWKYVLSGTGYGGRRNSVICDIDGDGQLEVLSGSLSNSLYSLNKNGGLEWTLDLPNSPRSLSVGDVDNDDSLDIVVRTSGGTYCLGLGSHDLGFRPDPNGWQFANSSGNMWPYNWQPGDPADERNNNCAQTRTFPTWALFREAFGVNQTEFQNGQRRPHAVDEWNAIKGCWGGSCFGFSVSSLLFFDSFLNVPTVCPGNTTLFQVQISDNSRELINRYWIYQFGSIQQQYLAAHSGDTPNQTLQQCRDMFKSETRNDRALRLSNNNGNRVGRHSVVPYRCEVDGSDPNLWYIYVYDNNYPNNETARISINTQSNTWDYSLLPGWGGAGGLILRDPMSNYTIDPVLPQNTLLLDNQGSRSNRELSEDVQFFVRSANHVSLQSAEGIIGQNHDSLFSTLSYGVPIIPEDGPLLGYYLRNDNWIIQVSDVVDSLFRMSLFTDSTTFVYSRSAVTSTQNERLLYPGNDSSLWVYNPDPSSRSYSLEIIYESPDSEVVCDVENITISAMDSVRHSVAPSSGVQLDNYGEQTTYDVRVRIASTSADTIFFHEGITLQHNTSHWIIPDWRDHHDSLAILVDSGMTGHFTDTMSIVNEEDPGNYICADANRDKIIDVGDVVYLINYLFKNGSAPNPLVAGDANFDGVVDVGDVIYMINYLFKGGPVPSCK